MCFCMRYCIHKKKQLCRLVKAYKHVFLHEVLCTEKETASFSLFLDHS